MERPRHRSRDTYKDVALEDGMKENRRFMKNCAKLEFVDSQKKASPGGDVTVTVTGDQQGRPQASHRLRGRAADVDSHQGGGQKGES